MLLLVNDFGSSACIYQGPLEEGSMKTSEGCPDTTVLPMLSMETVMM
jgi:hypothetical protein